MSEMGFTYHLKQFFPGCEHQGLLQGTSAGGYAWGECLVCYTELPWYQVYKFNQELRKLAIDLELEDKQREQDKEHEPALD